MYFQFFFDEWNVMEFRNYFIGDKLMCYDVKMFAQISDSTHSLVMEKRIPACGMKELLKNSVVEKKVKGKGRLGGDKNIIFILS